jgi:hypothetical protein
MSKITFSGDGILNKLPSSVQALLDKVGDKKIDSLEIFRRPLEKELTGALDFLTGDSVKKFLNKSNYDKLFHLGIIINNKFIFDKQENFHFVKIPKGFRKPNVEYSPVSNIPDITIKQLFRETRKKMGDKKFFGYDALKNNCQDFVVASLEAIGASFNKDFVKQDLTDLVKRIPKWQQKFSTALIGVARDVKRISGTGHCPMMGKNVNIKKELKEIATQLDGAVKAHSQQSQRLKKIVKIKGGIIDSSDEEEEQQQQPQPPPQNTTIIQQPNPILPNPNPGIIPILQNPNQSTIIRRRQQQQQNQGSQGSGMKKNNPWIDALKEYNKNKGQWCLPKKGSKEYDEVKKIMDNNKKPKKSFSEILKQKQIDDKRLKKKAQEDSAIKRRLARDLINSQTKKGDNEPIDLSKDKIDFSKKDLNIYKKKKGVIEPKKEKPKKSLIEMMKEFNKKYNLSEIKKQTFNTKEEVVKYSDEYIELVNDIENQLNKIEDKIEFIKNNKELSSNYNNNNKNFISRVKKVYKENKKK